MPEKGDKAQAEIPYSTIEYVGEFQKSLLGAAPAPATLIGAMLNALEPWGFGLDGVEAKTSTLKLADFAITFRRTKPLWPNNIVVLGLEKMTFSADNLDWEGSDQYIAQIAAGVKAVEEAGQARIKTQRLQLGMHIQLKTKPIRDVTSPLFNPKAFTLLDGDIKFPGIILLREKASVVIDASSGFANGLFVRLTREHPAGVTLEQIAQALKKDEEGLFEVLGLEGVL